MSDFRLDIKKWSFLIYEYDHSVYPPRFQKVEVKGQPSGYALRLPKHRLATLTWSAYR